ncbi:MAG TPA: indole-3-glycerol phosphate synthase TrpC, partial [Kofleriaceae bacterium]|nr:indole-3-glycerol phosphate synthase TrpC [Kofleriaceae bacterium]
AEVEAAALEVPPARSLARALRREPGQPARVLAEIKRASPSAGPIRPDADPVAIAHDYEAGGAAALSILTDRRYFDGDLRFLSRVRAAVELPLLRKDFLIDRYQVLEARAAGADAVLLIVGALDDALLAELHAFATQLGMDALVEVHDRAECERALAIGARLVGVNHRDLRTFTIDLGLTAALAPLVPAGTVLVAESGIRTPADVARVVEAGADAILVGESLMRAASPGQALRALLAP